MKKFCFPIAGFLVAFLLSSCADEVKAKVTYPTVIKVGKTLDANVIPTSYNENLKTQIRTEQASIVIEGARSILLGRESFVQISADGKDKQFCIGIERECFLMY